MLSKFAGGIGLAFHRVRSRGSLIRATNGHSKGIVPWLKTLDSSVAAVNQGGKRKGACCVYLETWHADIEEFLELRENTGDSARRTYNLNLANWVPDLFMKRVEADEQWSLFDPKVAPHLSDLYGEEFEKAYIDAEQKGLYIRQLRARDLYARMMKVLAETGNGWMTFKDACNRKCNQTADPANVVHLSNLCTEITEVTSKGETAVCNLGSVNLANHVREGAFDFAKLGRTVRTAVKYLDRVVDLNYYPITAAAESNHRWRPVGLGVMGLQDVFFLLRLPFDSPQAQQLSRKIQEEIYFHALSTSCDLAAESGPHAAFITHRHCPHGHHCLDCRRVRMHRAAGLESFQARDAVRRFSPGKPLPGHRAESVGALDRTAPDPGQNGGRLHPGNHGNSRRGTADLSYGLGDTNAFPHRHGGRPGRIYRSRPVAQPVCADTEHRQALFHVHVRVEEGTEDDLLPSLPSGDGDCQDHNRYSGDQRSFLFT